MALGSFGVCESTSGKAIAVKFTMPSGEITQIALGWGSALALSYELREACNRAIKEMGGAQPPEDEPFYIYRQSFKDAVREAFNRGSKGITW